MLPLRQITLAAALLSALAACAQSPRFLPMADRNIALAEAEAQRTASSQFSGTLTDRVRQLSPVGVITDEQRMARLQPVAERLFAAAQPLCRQQEIACSFPVQLEESVTLNAHATSRNLSISRPMVDLAATADQLALVLGHELAHAVLGHTVRDFGDRLARAFDHGRDKDDERQADYVGLYLAVRAGFDANQAITLWRRMGIAQPQIIQGDQVHPGTAERYVALRQAVAEIAAKRAAGKPLLPDLHP